MKLKMTTPLVRNSLSRSPLWRRVLIVTVPAAALVALAVGLQPVAHAGTTSTSTPTSTPPQFQLLTTVPIQSNAQQAVTVNRALNKIYTSGGASAGQDVEVIDGVTFATTDVGTGSGASVDNRTNRYWAATVYQDNLIVRDGTTDSVITTVPIPGGVCPIQTNYDFKKNRVWASAQCGAFHDPIFAINAKTFSVIAGPIDSGGVMGAIIANGANGRLYFSDQDGGVGNYISKRVDPTTFAVTVNAFGRVMAINALTNKLYAVPDTSNDLQIINGKPDPEVILTTVPLSYHPPSMGINPALNYLYIANPVGQSIEVRDPSTGALITTFPLSALGVTPDGPMAVDSLRSRIYVIQNSPPMLLVIEDLINAAQPDCILSH
jgi:hypothetical protein